MPNRDATGRKIPREDAVIRWARRRLLRMDLVHNLPKALQREFAEALLDAYAYGYEACLRDVNSAS